jgi:hypothetical protein
MFGCVLQKKKKIVRGRRSDDVGAYRARACSDRRRATIAKQHTHNYKHKANVNYQHPSQPSTWAKKAWQYELTLRLFNFITIK